MKSKQIILLLTSALVLVFLSGCVNVLQEMTIREDGSGTLRFALGVESAAYPQFLERLPEGMELENLLTNLLVDENITDVEQDTYESEGFTWQTIQMDVSNFAVVFADERTFGPITLEFEQDNETYTFLQTIDLVGSNMRIPGINLMDLSGAGYTIRLITPQLINTNGLQEAAGTSVWEVTLGDLMQGEETIFLQADYILEPYEGVFIPWETFFPYVVIGFLASGLIAILVVIIVNTTKRREKPETYKFK